MRNEMLNHAMEGTADRRMTSMKEKLELRNKQCAPSTAAAHLVLVRP